MSIGVEINVKRTKLAGQIFINIDREKCACLEFCVLCAVCSLGHVFYI